MRQGICAIVEAGNNAEHGLSIAPQTTDLLALAFLVCVVDSTHLRFGDFKMDAKEKVNALHSEHVSDISAVSGNCSDRVHTTDPVIASR